MNYRGSSFGSIAKMRLGARLRRSKLRNPNFHFPSQKSFFTFPQKKPTEKATPKASSTVPAAVITGGFFVWWLYPSDEFAQLSNAGPKRRQQPGEDTPLYDDGDELLGNDGQQNLSAWEKFTNKFGSVSFMTDVEWAAFSDKLVGYILPEWSKMVPGYVKKLQRELSMSPGSLADEIWKEAHDPLVNPEIRHSAKVRVSDELCDEEKEFLVRRRRIAKVALARYLGLKEEDVHPDDVPTIAMCGSGGGLRALVAGTGSTLATEEDGLLDCVTYTAGVSGSCWLQALQLTSFSKGSVHNLLDHLKARAGTHIAYPPVAFQSLVSMPTSKYLLSGMVEKLRGDARADFGLVDIYGVLLAARYLVPKGDLGVDERDFKLSNQREYIKYGQHPMPIYTAVRHEIPQLDNDANQSTFIDVEAAKEKAKREAWFQWFEMTPYEFFCEELGAGIPSWALGRRFNRGRDVPPEHGFHLPEVRLPLLMGIWGSAFCATLSHYYQEVKPIVRSMAGFGTVDELIAGRNEDLSKVHPIDPASIPNFAYGMDESLLKTTPSSFYNNEYIQLMDAGMSNNLPIYPLLRPGREVDVLIAFDASADIKTDNWLSVADGYARQREIRGWPVGIGWPKPGESPSETAKELDAAQAKSASEAERRVQEAKLDQQQLRREAHQDGQGDKSDELKSKFEPGDEKAGELGYCTVWVGTTEERSSEPPPPSKALNDETHWQLMEPDAGIAVVYLPFLANDKVPGISPGTTDYLSTWNFVYKPEQIDKIVELAKANYDEGKLQIKSTIRAVYERKKKLREAAEKDAKAKYRGARLRDGDQFS